MIYFHFDLCVFRDAIDLVVIGQLFQLHVKDENVSKRRKEEYLPSSLSDFLFIK